MVDILDEAIANSRNKLAGEVNTNHLVNRVKEILPINSSEYKILDVEGTNTKFKASVKANLKSEADVDFFIKNYARKNETLRILKTKKSLNENANTLVVKYTAISIKVVPEQSGKVEYECAKLAGG